MIAYQIIHYPDLVQPGAGKTCEWDEKYECDVTYGNRDRAEKSLLAQYPGKSLEEIWTYAQKRVESCLA